MTNAPYPDNVKTTYWHPSDPAQNDSFDNTYLSTIQNLELGKYKTGAYGASWGSVDLPASPEGGAWYIRVNTDDSNKMRLYAYNDESSSWDVIAEVGAAVSDHGGLTGLGDDDHPQYMPVDGSRAFSGYIDIEEIATPSDPPANTMRVYAVDEGGFTVLHYDDASGLDIEIGRDSVQVVRNNSGSTITEGSAVYITGSTGVYPTVDLADASDPAKMPAIGIVVADIATASFGQIITVGDVKGLDTSAYTEGAELFVSASSPGALTETAPTGANHRQSIAQVIKSNAGAGILDVLSRADISSLHIDHDQTTNAHNLTTDIDHGSISGLGGDDHTQYHNDTRADTWFTNKRTDQLADVSSTLPNDNEFLLYDSVGSEYVPTELNEAVEDIVGGMVGGGSVQSYISVSYDDTNGELDFSVAVLDEDTMISNSDAHLSTQQAIKAYVDSQNHHTKYTDAEARSAFEVSPPSSDYDNYGDYIAYSRSGNTSANDPADYYTILHIGASSNSDFQLASSYASDDGVLYYRKRHDTTGTWKAWTRIWLDVDFTATQISNWDTAYGWGNHASAGYLSSYGSVTNHSDVSDPGSGIIISVAERNGLHTSHSYKTNINSIDDVVITSVADNEILQYSTGMGWINQTLAEAGISAVGHSHPYASTSHTHTETDITNLDHYTQSDWESDFGVTESELVSGISFGSSRSAMVPCPLSHGASMPPENNGRMVISTTGWYNFILPMPTQKSSLDLYIGDVLLSYVQSSTSHYYVNQVILRAYDYNTTTDFISDGTSLSGTNSFKTYTNTPDNVSAYDVVVVMINIQKGAGSTPCKISVPTLETYYA